MKCDKCNIKVYGKSNICPICGSLLKSKLTISKIFLIIILVPILGGFFTSFFTDPTNSKKENNVQSQSSPDDEKIKEIKNVKLINDYEHYYDNESYSKDTIKMMNRLYGIESGSEMFAPLNKYVTELYVKFENHNPYDVRDIKYSCLHYAESGTVIKKNEGVKYIGIPADGYVYRRLNLGFRYDDESQIRCSCTGFKKG